MKKLFFILLCLTVTANCSYATIVTAIPPGGNWNNGGTWDGAAPGCYDTIIIPAGASVNMSSSINLTGCPPVKIIIFGNLHFNQSFKLELPCNSWVMFMPGGTMTADNYGNNSKQLKICGTAVWKGQDGPVGGPGGFGNPPLPIELVNFDARWVDNERRVLLDWRTASETNNDFFTIERSSTGIDWFPIFEVDGSGTSSIAIDYLDYDENPLFGESYYRLRQTDFDGEFSVSPAVRLSSTPLQDVVIYPNPIQNGNDLIINLPEGFKLSGIVGVYDMLGKLLVEKDYNHKGTNQIFFHIGSSIASGTYLLKVEEFSTRIVVQ